MLFHVVNCRFSVMASIWELKAISQFFGHNVPKYWSENFACREWILALVNTYDMSHHTCTYVKWFLCIWIEDRKPLAASGGSMARYWGKPKMALHIVWYRAMFVPSCRTVAFIVTEEMRAERNCCKKNKKQKNKNKDSTAVVARSINIIIKIRIVPQV